MSNRDVIFDDVTKTCYTNFLISYHKLYHLKDLGQGFNAPKIVPCHDKYFSCYDYLKKC